MKKKYFFIAGLLIIVLFFTIGGYFIQENHRETVLSMPQKYCYETFRNNGRAKSVLIISDLDLKDDYLWYYLELKSGVEPVLPDPIPLKGLTANEIVYVMGFSKDSLLADVVSLYDRGPKFGGSYTRGWVLAECLHDEPFQKEER